MRFSGSVISGERVSRTKKVIEERRRVMAKYLR
jgi:hypothetical protein